MAVIYLIGIATTFIYNWLMVGISQGVLKKVRDEMFAHIQKLPIRYFDTHTHGDLMSHFTNDTDTLQQMLSQDVYKRQRLYWPNIKPISRPPTPISPAGTSVN